VKGRVKCGNGYGKNSTPTLYPNDIELTQLGIAEILPVIQYTRTP
jgi:hypothetical protein